MGEKEGGEGAESLCPLLMVKRSSKIFRAGLEVASAGELRRMLSDAKVKLVLRSRNRHRVHGVLHRQKLVVKRDLDAGGSTVVLKASRLLVDTWVVTATARTLGVDSAPVKKQLVVVAG